MMHAAHSLGGYLFRLRDQFVMVWIRWRRWTVIKLASMRMGPGRRVRPTDNTGL